MTGSSRRDGVLLVTGATCNNGATLTERPGIFTVNPTTGEQRILTTNFPAGARPIGIAEGKDGTIFVTESAIFPYAIRAFNADGSNPRILTTGGFIRGPYYLTIDSTGQLLVSDWITKGIVRVNPNTGLQTIVTTNLSSPRDMTITENGDIIVGEGATDTILRIDPLTGVQTVLSTNIGNPGPIQVFIPKRPALKITRNANQLILSWPASSTDFLLQVTPNFGTNTVWSSVTNEAVEVGAEKRVTVPMDSTGGCFRLSKE